MTTPKTIDVGTDKLHIMELPPRGPSQQSSTIEKPSPLPEVPVDVERNRQVSRKATYKPDALPHRGDKTSNEHEIGDLYDCKIDRKAWEIDTSSRPYLKYVKSLSEGWPHITWLADFMEVGTSPLKWKNVDENETERRAKRTRIAVIDMSPDSKPVRRDVQSSEKLTDLLSHPGFNHDPAFARIFIVEDLSRDVIEALGNEYDIDPLFFRSQISDYLWYNIRDPWVELNDLEHIANERNFFNIRYMTPRYFATENSINTAKDSLGRFNVLRRLEQDLSWKVRKQRKPEGPTVGLIRSKASLWIRNNKKNEKGTLGILVVDPTLSEGYPLWAGPRNLKPCPSMHEPLPPAPPRTSLFEDIIHYTMEMSNDDLSSVPKQNTALSIPILNIVAAEWLTVVNYITTGLTIIEYELEHTEYRKDGSPTGLDSALERLHPLRRLIPVYRTFIKEILTTILAPSNLKPSLSTISSPNSCHLIKLRSEFESILDRIDRLQTRTQSIVSLATAIISIDENKRAMRMNKNLVRVTYLAVVFVPVQFVSSFFSMTPDLGSLKQTFWIYFVIAVPLTLLCLTIADPPRVVRGFKHALQKGRGLLGLKANEAR